MTIKTEYENGTLTTYPNQYRFVSGDEDVRIFRGTPLHILDYEIKRDLRDTFNLRIKIIEEKEEVAVAGGVQATFNVDNSAELQELKQKYIALKKQRISLQKENNELRKKIQSINRKDDRYSEIFEMYLLESGSLQCPRCHHQLKLRVTKKGRNKGVIFFGCEDYQYNSHSDCRYRKEIDGVTYVMHQRMIDSFLAKPHYDFDGNLIENVRLPLPSEYYQKYLKGMMDDGS